jgi:hypothetical protein
VEWARRFMLRPGFELASPVDLTIPTCVDGAAEAIDVIRARHATWTAQHAAP